MANGVRARKNSLLTDGMNTDYRDVSVILG